MPIDEIILTEHDGGIVTQSGDRLRQEIGKEAIVVTDERHVLALRCIGDRVHVSGRATIERLTHESDPGVPTRRALAPLGDLTGHGAIAVRILAYENFEPRVRLRERGTDRLTQIVQPVIGRYTNGDQRVHAGHSYTTRGQGIGTMNRPPRPRYSACWTRISSRNSRE